MIIQVLGRWASVMVIKIGAAEKMLVSGYIWKVGLAGFARALAEGQETGGQGFCLWSLKE